MTHLHIFSNSNANDVLFESSEAGVIAQQLIDAGVQFEQWPLQHVDTDAIDIQAAVLKAYDAAVSELKVSAGHQMADVISLAVDNPQKEELRKKFLAEHTHAEDEVRFFVAGAGLFSLHIADKVYVLECTAGDLINVPANTKHWFDMGANPQFTCIRLFTNPEGWVGHITGDTIADQYPRMER
mgnify:CR=1 FL=1